ncbi:MAG: response regulator [Agarilytica sp.]
MKKVLVVEDSSLVMKVLKHVLSNSTLFQFDYAMDFAEAKALCEQNDDGYFAALVDLSLPDAPNGEVVDFCLSKGFPTVVLTGSFNEENKNTLLAKGIVDYVTKEGRFSYEYALSVLERLVKNQDVKVLVVDDSDTARRYVAALLRLQLFQVFEAKDSVQALKLIIDNPDLRLMIVDFHMPRMNGCELIKNIRLKYEKTDMMIIGVSSDTNGSMSAQFIKNGANDFLRKPFNHEEFHCRVAHNVEFLELIKSLRESAYRDDETGAFNRKYFYDTCEKTFAEPPSSAVSMAIVNIDEFDGVNERYGHDIGDHVMQRAVQEFHELLDRFLVVRNHGPEFYILLQGLNCEKATAFIEKVRQMFATADLGEGEHTISLSFSAGVSGIKTSNVDDLVNAARLNLRRAWEAGGDLVFGDD